MNSLFIMLLPSLISTKLIAVLTGKKDYKELIYYYMLTIFISNLICLIVVILFNHFDGNIISYIQLHLKFAIKYTLLLSVVNIIVGFIFSFLIKYFKISLEVSNEQKNKKNK